MPTFSPVRRGVPGQRIVAATDVAAGRTPPQVHPPTAGSVTLGAAGTTGRHRRVDSSSHRGYSFLADGMHHNVVTTWRDGTSSKRIPHLVKAAEYAAPSRLAWAQRSILERASTNKSCGRSVQGRLGYELRTWRFSLFARSQKCRSNRVVYLTAAALLHRFELVSRSFVPKSVPNLAVAARSAAG
jgi:hypothetical protein